MHWHPGIIEASVPAAIMAVVLIGLSLRPPAILAVQLAFVWSLPVLAGSGFLIPFSIESTFVPPRTSFFVLVSFLVLWFFYMFVPRKLPIEQQLCAVCRYPWTSEKRDGARCPECGSHRWMKLASNKKLDMKPIDANRDLPWNHSRSFYLLLGGALALPFVGIAAIIVAQWFVSPPDMRAHGLSPRLISNASDSIFQALINITLWLAATLPACWLALQAARVRYQDPPPG